jgi:alpha-ketoglutarate-dependent taurine dioxygenase
MKLHPFNDAPDGLPLVIEPEASSGQTTDDLLAWIGENGDLARERLRHHGALLFRGFAVDTAPDFERVALAVEPNLGREYLGTSPRNALTRYVFSASELPGWYPIPQHCEMTFLASPPKRLFFCCLVPSTGVGGETPLVDFRKVQAALDAEVLERFVARGVRIIRNYTGPGGGGRFNVFQLKRWDEMFLTTDRASVEEKCREQGFTATWLPGGRLRLVSDHPALRAHPETGQPVWHNHAQVFHLGAGAGEYRRIFLDRRDVRSFALWQFARAMTAVQRRVKSSEEQSMHCTYADGGEIPEADMEHLRDVIWKNMVRFRWQKGDVVAIDNYAVSHGRMPYTGPRQIVVAWA